MDLFNKMSDLFLQMNEVEFLKIFHQMLLIEEIKQLENHQEMYRLIKEYVQEVYQTPQKQIYGNLEKYVRANFKHKINENEFQKFQSDKIKNQGIAMHSDSLFSVKEYQLCQVQPLIPLIYIGVLGAEFQFFRNLKWWKYDEHNENYFIAIENNYEQDLQQLIQNKNANIALNASHLGFYRALEIILHISLGFKALIENDILNIDIDLRSIKLTEDLICTKFTNFEQEMFFQRFDPSDDQIIKSPQQIEQGIYSQKSFTFIVGLVIEQLFKAIINQKHLSLQMINKEFFVSEILDKLAGECTKKNEKDRMEISEVISRIYKILETAEIPLTIRNNVFYKEFNWNQLPMKEFDKQKSFLEIERYFRNSLQIRFPTQIVSNIPLAFELALSMLQENQFYQYRIFFSHPLNFAMENNDPLWMKKNLDLFRGIYDKISPKRFLFLHLMILVLQVDFKTQIKQDQENDLCEMLQSIQEKINKGKIFEKCLNELQTGNSEDQMQNLESSQEYFDLITQLKDEFQSKFLQNILELQLLKCKSNIQLLEKDKIVSNLNHQILELKTIVKQRQSHENEKNIVIDKMINDYRKFDNFMYLEQHKQLIQAIQEQNLEKIIDGLVKIGLKSYGYQQIDQLKEEHDTIRIRKISGHATDYFIVKIEGKKFFIQTVDLFQQPQGDVDFFFEQSITEILLYRIGHRYLPQAHGFCINFKKNVNEIYTIMDYYHCNLKEACFQQVQPYKSKPLNSFEKLSLMLSCCYGLKVLHKMDVIHRDIHPTSIFLVQGNRKEAILGDLGFSIIQQKIKDADIQKSQYTTHTFHQDVKYNPPQWHQLGILSIQSDIFKLGVVISEVLKDQMSLRLKETIMMTQNNERYKRPTIDDLILIISLEIQNCDEF